MHPSLQSPTPTRIAGDPAERRRPGCQEERRQKGKNDPDLMTTATSHRTIQEAFRTPLRLLLGHSNAAKQTMFALEGLLSADLIHKMSEQTSAQSSSRENGWCMKHHSCIPCMNGTYKYVRCAAQAVIFERASTRESR